MLWAVTDILKGVPFACALNSPYQYMILVDWWRALSSVGSGDV